MTRKEVTFGEPGVRGQACEPFLSCYGVVSYKGWGGGGGGDRGRYMVINNDI